MDTSEAGVIIDLPIEEYERTIAEVLETVRRNGGMLDGREVISWSHDWSRKHSTTSTRDPRQPILTIITFADGTKRVYREI